MIPIHNIYYLLSYSWNNLDEGDRIDVSKDDFNSLLNLLSKVLITATTQLLKRGLDRDYHLISEPYVGIKGKLLISNSIKANAFNQGFTICEYDDFNHNTLHNQILKFTIRRLLFTSGVDLEYRIKLKALLARMHSIEYKAISINDFTKVRLGKNNAYYRFALNVCKILFQNIVLNEEQGKYEFIDFIRSDSRMAHLFESFLRNFYRQHSGFDVVKGENIEWQAKPINENVIRIPQMKTDISLMSANRKIIMDAKFYRQALQTHYDKESIRSGHLYQLFAYLKNELSSDDFVTEGILIYPTVTSELDEKYDFNGHPLTIASINLDQDWQNIEKDLIRIIS